MGDKRETGATGEGRSGVIVLVRRIVACAQRLLFRSFGGSRALPGLAMDRVLRGPRFLVVGARILACGLLAVVAGFLLLIAFPAAMLPPVAPLAVLGATAPAASQWSGGCVGGWVGKLVRRVCLLALVACRGFACFALLV